MLFNSNISIVISCSPEEPPVLLSVGEPRPAHPHVLQQPEVCNLGDR